MLSAKAHSALLERHFEREAAFWRDIYAQSTLYGELYRQRMATVLHLVSSICLPAGGRAAEIGCGAGMVTVALAKRGWRVEAVDIAPRMVAQTRSQVESEGVADLVRVRQGNVNRLDLPLRSFDLVVAVGVLEWMPRLDEPLAALAAILKPGGHLIVNIDNSRALHCWLDPRLMPPAGPAKRLALSAARRFGWIGAEPRPATCSRPRLRRALHTAGFSMVVDQTIGFGPFTFLGHPLFSEAHGLLLDRRLQALADRGVPLLQRAGSTSVVLARRTADRV
ncbi:MAG: class I SAM-dependent methyltransferase [Bryobacteraceae bacterium]